MKNLLITALLLNSGMAFSQTVYVGPNPMSNKNIRPWVVQSPAVYAGAYQFGFSEREASVTIVIRKGLLTAFQDFVAGPQATKGRKVKKQLTHVRIMGNRLFSDQVNGEFVTFTTNNSLRYGLKMNSSWNSTEPVATVEVGLRTN